ncbi:MAG: ATP-binding protein [Candidatus Zixiibacteriota bacterium]
MAEIIVASGKGGTGKTSLVGALVRMAKKTTAVDCDVDAANLHLLLSHEIVRSNEFSSSRCAEIVDTDCSGCGLCEELCRFGAIERLYDEESSRENRFVVDPLSCEGCGLCFHVCPDRAITMQPVISGQWFESVTEFGPFLHGRLGIAQANSGKLVTLLRRKAREVAELQKCRTIIIDGPPGIGCPVIASMTGADYLLIVTEPSKSAVHDMERLVMLARQFNMKTGICINKCDFNPTISRNIEAFAFTEGIPILGKLIFDRGFVDAQIAGESYLDRACAENTQAISHIWQEIENSIIDTQQSPTGKFSV